MARRNAPRPRHTWRALPPRGAQDRHRRNGGRARENRCDRLASRSLLQSARPRAARPAPWMHHRGDDRFRHGQEGAISRTYIDESLRKVSKARTLGSPAGIVRLTPDEDVTNGLCLVEGLETALSAMMKGLRPIWSTGSTALLKTFAVLDGIDCLTVIADRDASAAGENAARQVEARWRQAGRKTRVFIPESLGDLNDLLQRARG